MRDRKSEIHMIFRIGPDFYPRDAMISFDLTFLERIPYVLPPRDKIPSKV